MDLKLFSRAALALAGIWTCATATAENSVVYTTDQHSKAVGDGATIVLRQPTAVATGAVRANQSRSRKISPLSTIPITEPAPPPAPRGEVVVVESRVPQRARAEGGDIRLATAELSRGDADQVQTARYEEAVLEPDPMPEPPPHAPLNAAHIDQIVQEPLVSAVDQLLLEAHKLSLSAGSSNEYTQIAKLCAEALQQCDNNERKQFAKQLAAWALNRRGELRAERGEGDLALADFDVAATLDTKSWRSLHNRSVTYAQRGRFAEAFDDVSRVVELNPAFAKAFSNRATLYVQAGDPELALADYDAALEIDGALVAAQVGRGRVCHMLGRFEEALRHFNRAVDLDDGNAEVVCSRADLHADLGNYENALADYATAVEIDPRFAHAYRNGAWLLATCPDEEYRDVENALHGAQQAVKHGYGERYAALDTLGAALANAGQFSEAIKVMRMALESAPEEVRPAYQERLTLYEAGKPYRTRPIEGQ